MESAIGVGGTWPLTSWFGQWSGDLRQTKRRGDERGMRDESSFSESVRLTRAASELLRR